VHPVGSYYTHLQSTSLLTS